MGFVDVFRFAHITNNLCNFNSNEITLCLEDPFSIVKTKMMEGLE